MIQLAAGWNYVTYTGPDDVASNVFADIDPYLLTKNWVDEYGYWWPIFFYTLMTAGLNCTIEVSQACLLENFEWTGVPPGIQLATGANNVAYEWDAPETTLADALAGIASVLIAARRWNRETELWDKPTIVKPGEHWEITVSQVCALENFRWWVIRIDEVVVAERAVVGATVQVEVRMFNCRLGTVSFACTGLADGVTVEFPYYVDCPGIRLRSVVGYFTMPNNDVTLAIQAFYWDGSSWILDDWKQKTVQVEGEVTYAFTVGSPSVSAA